MMLTSPCGTRDQLMHVWHRVRRAWRPYGARTGFYKPCCQPESEVPLCLIILRPSGMVRRWHGAHVALTPAAVLMRCCQPVERSKGMSVHGFSCFRLLAHAVPVLALLIPRRRQCRNGCAAAESGCSSFARVQYGRLASGAVSSRQPGGGMATSLNAS
jgi:hypothetical protein